MGDSEHSMTNGNEAPKMLIGVGLTVPLASSSSDELGKLVVVLSMYILDHNEMSCALMLNDACRFVSSTIECVDSLRPIDPFPFRDVPNFLFALQSEAKSGRKRNGKKNARES